MILVALVVVALLVWAVIEVFAWTVAAWVAIFRTPERMARKHPETIDPTTGKQVILYDFTKESDQSSGGGHQSRRSGLRKARKWGIRVNRRI